MIVSNLNVIGIAVMPGEAYAILVIYSNAVSPGAITLEHFKPVTRRHTKILQAPCLMQVQKFPPRGSFDRLKTADHTIVKKQFGIRTLKRPDQSSSL
jgi:hypothetical protein